MSRHAEKAGADAVLVVTPYYNKPTQEGMFQHFKAVNDAIGIPIIIYNIPPRSVVDMSVDTMKRLFELKNIAGVKDATGNLARVSLQRQAMGPDFIQLSGEDMTALAFNAAGGHGCISVVSNVAPALCKQLQDTTLAGDYEARHDRCRIAWCRCTMRSSWSRAWPARNADCRCSGAATKRCGCRFCRSRRRPRPRSAAPWCMPGC